MFFLVVREIYTLSTRGWVWAYNKPAKLLLWRRWRNSEILLRLVKDTYVIWDRTNKDCNNNKRNLEFCWVTTRIFSNSCSRAYIHRKIQSNVVKWFSKRGSLECSKFDLYIYAFFSLISIYIRCSIETKKWVKIIN